VHRCLLASSGDLVGRWVELGGEKRPGGLQDLVGPAQLAVLALQRLQALTLFAAEQLGALAFIRFGLPHPLAQGLVGDAEISCYVGDRAAGVEDDPGAAIEQLSGYFVFRGMG